MDQTHFWVLFKDGRTATEQTPWVEPLDQLLGSDEVRVGWLDLQAPYAVDLEDLQEKFGFHPHAIEDCRRFDQRAKLEAYSNHWFWVFHGSSMATEGKVVLHEMHGFLTGRWLVTVHQEEMDGVSKLSERWNTKGPGLPRTPVQVWMRILSTLIEQHASSLSRLAEQIEAIDDEMTQKLRDGQIDRIHELKMGLKSLRRILAPQVEYMRAVFEGRLTLSQESEDLLDVRAAKDHAQLLVEKLDLAVEETVSLRDSYAVDATLASNRAMTRLTMVSVVFLPLTFVTGFFGMNFQSLPFADGRWFWSVILFCIVAPFAVLGWIRRKNS